MPKQPLSHVLAVSALYSTCVPLVIFLAAPRGRRPCAPGAKHTALSLLLPCAVLAVSVIVLFAPAALLGATVAKAVAVAFTEFVSDAASSHFAQKVETSRHATIGPLLLHVFPAAAKPLHLSTGTPIAQYLEDLFPSFDGDDVADAASTAARSINFSIPFFRKQEIDVMRMSDEEFDMAMSHSWVSKHYFAAFNKSLSADAPNWYEQSLEATSRALKSVNITTFLRMPDLSPSHGKMHRRITGLINSLAVEVDFLQLRGELRDQLQKKLDKTVKAIEKYATFCLKNASTDNVVSYIDRSATQPTKERLKSLMERYKKLVELLARLTTMGVGVPRKLWNSTVDSLRDGPKTAGSRAVFEKTRIYALAVSMFVQFIRTGVMVALISLLSSRGKPSACVAYVYQAAWTGALTALSITVPTFAVLVLMSLPFGLRFPPRFVRVVFCGVPARATAQALIALAVRAKRGRMVAILFAFAVEEMTVWRLPGTVAATVGLTDWMGWMQHGFNMEAVIIVLACTLSTWVAIQARRIDGVHDGDVQ